MFNIPILLITFNRPAHTRRVIETVMRNAPATVYVFQDGERPGNANDGKMCQAVRDVISELTSNTGTCVHTFYSEKNYGCGPGPVAAITWFFNEVERGIILEDDCLLDDSAFHLYEYLLDRYDSDRSVSMITMTNVFKKWKSWKSSYFFATNGASPMGCWAGWSRNWKSFDYHITAWKDRKTRQDLSVFFDRKEYYDFYSDLYDVLSTGNQTHMWDYQWAFARYLAGSKTIVVSQNLMSNIGFSEGATHSSDANHRFANLPRYPLGAIVDPRNEKVDRLFNYLYFFRNNYRRKKSLFLRLKLKTIEFLFCR